MKHSSVHSFCIKLCDAAYWYRKQGGIPVTEPCICSPSATILGMKGANCPTSCPYGHQCPKTNSVVRNQCYRTRNLHTHTVRNCVSCLENFGTLKCRVNIGAIPCLPWCHFTLGESTSPQQSYLPNDGTLHFVFEFFFSVLKTTLAHFSITLPYVWHYLYMCLCMHVCKYIHLGLGEFTLSKNGKQRVFPRSSPAQYLNLCSQVSCMYTIYMSTCCSSHAWSHHCNYHMYSHPRWSSVHWLLIHEHLTIIFYQVSAQVNKYV